MDNIILDQIYDFHPKNKKHIESIKNDIDRALPLIGAGMSIPFGCLSLNDLLIKLAIEWFKDDESVFKIVDDNIKNNTIHRAIDILDETHFKGRIQSFLEEHFEKKQFDLSANLTRFNSLEKIINRINKRGTMGSNFILTTNYDNVIECTIDEMNKKKNANIKYDVFSPHSNNLSKLFDKEFTDKLKVFKFHGDYKDRDSLVITTDSFKANYGITGDLEAPDIKVDHSNNVNKILRKILGNHSILFLGCSLDEDPFIKLFRSWLTHSMYRNYAVLLKPENNDDMRNLSKQALLMDTSVIWVKEGNYDWIDAIIEYVFTLSSLSSKPTGINLLDKQDNSFIESNTAESNAENDNESNESEPNEEKEDSGMPQLEELLQRKIRVVQTGPTKFAISFPMYKIEGGLYEIYLVAENKIFYISDEGTTYEELDKIFELKEPDVIKNILAILNQYGCRKHESSNAFIIECTPQNIHVKISYFIQAISFLLNMKIFYV